MARARGWLMGLVCGAIFSLLHLTPPQATTTTHLNCLVGSSTDDARSSLQSPILFAHAIPQYDYRTNPPLPWSRYLDNEALENSLCLEGRLLKGYIQAASRNEAAIIAQALVQENLIISAMIVPSVVSIPSWGGQFFEGENALLIIKTASLVKEVVNQVIAAMPQNPLQVTFTRVMACSQGYLYREAANPSALQSATQLNLGSYFTGKEYFAVLDVFQPLKITMEGNGGTGYSWRFIDVFTSYPTTIVANIDGNAPPEVHFKDGVSVSDPHLLLPQPTSSDLLVGRLAVYESKILATTAGTYYVVYGYLRAWLPNESPAFKIVQLQVNTAGVFTLVE